MLSERLVSGVRRPAVSSSHSLRPGGDSSEERIFEELPTAAVVSVSRPDASDITPLLLSYTIELQYKQFKWRILKKASQVIYLHFALKKHAIIEEFHEKQEQVSFLPFILTAGHDTSFCIFHVKEWLQNVGLGDHTTVVHDVDEPDDGAVPVYNDDYNKNRYVPSSAALSIIRPSIGKQQNVSDKAKAAMQGYLNHFLGNLDIINSREVKSGN
ncbi:phospholipase D [Striga asiatica]|uniref:Phospholipase D n=1 Tax=Striga asiatica TaxID=4170 RepID=A0A5A7RES4_STRAF|nr:phospholipase D [Striga asiatica]